MEFNSYNDATLNWATQMGHSRIGESMAQAPPQEVFPYADLHDGKSIYSDGFAGSEDLHNFGAVSGVASLKRYASTYDDPYSDVVSTFDMPAPTEAGDGDAPLLDRNSNLLSFSAPTYDLPLLNYLGMQTTMLMSAQLYGMFLLAQSASGDAQMPSELTCYRRNLFQVNGDIIMPRNLRYVVTPDGEQIAIMATELVVQAFESLEGNPVKIISVPWKTPAGPGQSTSDDQPEKEPSALPLDNTYTQDPDSEYAKVPFSWKRLQFRIATANNGRRKELQQHFVVKVRVMATLATGGKVAICEVQSGALIVRGRSPRNFQSRKDLPLNGGSTHGRKARTPSGDAAKKHTDAAPTSAPIQGAFPASAKHQQYAESDIQINIEAADAWQEQTQYGLIDNSIARNHNLDAGNVYPASSPDKVGVKKSPIQSSAPISLKLVEDETPKPASASQTPTEPRSAKRMQISPQPPSFAFNTLNSPDESADLLYEYFPLSLSDWSEPVDAVYRPHVVHHIRTKLPSEAVYGMRNVKSKRMYVE